MKKMKFFLMASCPHCAKAKSIMAKLENENPLYKTVEFEEIDENIYPSIANQYDYWYVPCFFLDDEKLHEGSVNDEIIKMIYERALEEKN